MFKQTICVSALALFLWPASLLAQASQTTPNEGAHSTRAINSGAVRGVVKDNSGAVIPNAKVTLTDQAGTTRTANTRPDGSYVFRGVTPGTYTVSAEVKGLAQAGVVAVSVGPSQPAHGDVVMRPENLTQEVTVAENSTTQVSTDPSQNATQLVLKNEDLAALPDDPDDLAAGFTGVGRSFSRPWGWPDLRRRLFLWTASRPRSRFARFESTRIRFRPNSTSSDSGGSRFLQSQAPTNFTGQCSTRSATAS